MTNGKGRGKSSPHKPNDEKEIDLWKEKRM